MIIERISTENQSIENGHRATVQWKQNYRECLLLFGAIHCSYLLLFVAIHRPYLLLFVVISQ